MQIHVRRCSAFVAVALAILPAGVGAAADLDGYTIALADDPQLSRFVVTNSKVEFADGVLRALEGDGLVRSAHSYSDFVLELSWRPLKESAYDAGVYFRCEAPPEGKPWPARYQINLKQGEEGALIGAGLAPPPGLVRPGDWNQMKLVVQGSVATLEINGQLAWQTDKIEPGSGFVGLQVEAPLGGAFEYRDLRITELGHRSLFNGQNLDGWEGAQQDAAACWTVENQELVCTGQPGPFLRSREQFDDFNLRLEYKLLPGGNSGVYIRVPADGNHHGENAGIEVQLLDDHSTRYSELKDYQFSASLYAVAPATQRVARPAENWNLLEIDCRGESYRIYHNGVLTTAGEAAQFPEIMKRLKSGFLGLQNHSERVWFRNIRIAPSMQPTDAARPVRELLAHRVIADGLTLEEAQEFCEPRVAKMPPLETKEEWDAYLSRLRGIVLDRVMYRGEAQAWRKAECKVEWLETIDAAPEYRIKKLRYEVLPGLWIPALLYEPTSLAEKTPVGLNVNGHDANGKAAPYKQIRCINMAKRGMLVLNVEWFGMGQLRTDGFSHARLNQIDLCGTSGLAPFLLAMQRGLDVLLSHPNADPDRVAVSGLSGGGWQTITVSSLDTRVTLANPVAGYSSFITRIYNFSDLGDSEQTPCDLAVHADYTHLTAMLSPRYALLTFNDRDDCCFATAHAMPPLVEAARPVFAASHAEDRLRTHTNADPGTHNFERDNREAFYRMIHTAFYHDDPSFSATEIPSDAEVKTGDELNVPLPDGNLDFHQLASQLAAQLPRNRQLPATAADDPAWRKAAIIRLGQITHYHDEYHAEAQREATDSWRGYAVTHWKIGVGNDWTVPATEIEPASCQGTVLVLNDAGRSAAGGPVHDWLNRGYRVVALDPFYCGEARVNSHDYLFALLIGSVGERPLGVQASQLAAIARWLSNDRKAGPVAIASDGPRTSLMALVAAAAEQRAIASLELHSAYGSLKEVIDTNISFGVAPEVFCFGLLEQFDVRELTAMVAPREVRFAGASERARTELADIAGFYQLLGKDFSPIH